MNSGVGTVVDTNNSSGVGTVVETKNSTTTSGSGSGTTGDMAA